MLQDFNERFKSTTGSRYFLSAGNRAEVEEYLNEKDFLIPGEEVLAIMPAGEGNMNVTLRVLSSRRRFIVKQSRPWVARFPELDAPVERILIERSFYQAIARNRFLTGHMPEILRCDAENFAIIMEDLGPADDLSSIYGTDRSLGKKQLATLLQFASELHGLTVEAFPPNRLLKALNHAQIFELPFQAGNNFPLDAIYPGLAAVARPYQHDARLKAVVSELGAIYLNEGSQLIHGDFYPGSFLNVDDRVHVIDAEFAHRGRAEFDIGVLMGHLLMSRANGKRIHQIDTDYRKPAGYDDDLARRFCYLEIMRRIIGIAQLPLSLTLDERKHLLERARAGLV
ncbi:5-methylthioribose kinase [Neolewinella xylanilytica]|uniref:5-methylthioribose kinase n=1 Tax=Neolewinella xylanilytica TaxID=1514080 RepID=A0A2S6I1P9_9BACT|nr:phosphotransferase [Neolewinella xylanilytica]PPK85098.1 5-methylthioribose kinase [Neolewinella xylanilytica]